MAVLENWGTNGTSGNYNWEFSPSGNPWQIGTYDGTLGLQGWSGTTGTAYIDKTYEWDTGGSCIFRVWGGTTVHGPYFAIGTDAGGTVHYVGVFRGRYWAWKRYYNGTRLALSTGGAANDGNVWTEIELQYSGTNVHGTFKTNSGTSTYIYTSFSGARDSGMYIDILPPGGTTGGTNYLVDYVQYGVSPYKTILDFIGTYNDGTSTGTYSLGDAVLNYGPVTEYANTPMSMGGFASSVPIKLTDKNDVWTNLVGIMDDPTWVNGVFVVRQQWNNTWYNLLTGNVNAEDVDIDAGKRIVSFSVNSKLKRLAEETLSSDAHYSNATGAAITDSMTLLMMFGTITGTADGVISFERSSTAYTHPDGGLFNIDFHDNEYLWNGTDIEGDTVRIGSVYHKVGDTNSRGSLFKSGGSYSGTFHTSTMPDWMIIGAIMYYTRRWPNRSQINVTSPGYVDYGDNAAGYIECSLLHMGFGTGTNWTKFKNDINLFYPIVPHKFYYSGEKFVDILNDIARSAPFSYSTDASGDFSGYCMCPRGGTAEATPSAGRYSHSIAYQKTWKIGYTQPNNQIIIKSGWNETDNKYEAVHKSTGTDYPSGRTATIEAPWMDSKVLAQANANRLQLLYGNPLAQISLFIEGSKWNDITTGEFLVISSIPSAYPLNGSEFDVSGKMYHPNIDMTEIDLTQRIGRGYFRLDLSTMDGPDVLW